MTYSVMIDCCVGDKLSWVVGVGASISEFNVFKQDKKTDSADISQCLHMTSYGGIIVSSSTLNVASC